MIPRFKSCSCDWEPERNVWKRESATSGDPWTTPADTFQITWSTLTTTTTTTWPRRWRRNAASAPTLSTFSSTRKISIRTQSRFEKNGRFVVSDSMMISQKSWHRLKTVNGFAAGSSGYSFDNRSEASKVRIQQWGIGLVFFFFSFPLEIRKANVWSIPIVRKLAVFGNSS